MVWLRAITVNGHVGRPDARTLEIGQPARKMRPKLDELWDFIEKSPYRTVTFVEEHRGVIRWLVDWKAE